MGFDKRRPIVAKATGGRVAAPVWARLMARYYHGKPPPRPWPRPTTIVDGWVDAGTGFVLAAGCRPTAGSAYRELFALGRRPVAVCPYEGEPQALEATLVGIRLLPDEEAPLATAQPLPAGTALQPAAAAHPADTGVRSYVPSWREQPPAASPTPPPPR